MRMAYADPPYIGQAKKHYEGKAGYAGEVDHAELIADLLMDYPDGWALSLSAKSLQYVLSLCPPSVRVCAWFKPWSNMLPGIRVQYSWEPIIVFGGRQGPHVKGNPLLRDAAIVANPEGYTFRVLPDGSVIGRKPQTTFCFWLFNVMGLEPSDEFVDLYPGNGAVTQAWGRWTALGGPRVAQSVQAQTTSAPDPEGRAA